MLISHTHSIICTHGISWARYYQHYLENQTKPTRLRECWLWLTLMAPDSSVPALSSLADKCCKSEQNTWSSELEDLLTLPGSCRKDTTHVSKLKLHEKCFGDTRVIVTNVAQRQKKTSCSRALPMGCSGTPAPSGPSGSF